MIMLHFSVWPSGGPCWDHGCGVFNIQPVTVGEAVTRQSGPRESRAKVAHGACVSACLCRPVKRRTVLVLKCAGTHTSTELVGGSLSRWVVSFEGQVPDRDWERSAVWNRQSLFPIHHIETLALASLSRKWRWSASVSEREGNVNLIGWARTAPREK